MVSIEKEIKNESGLHTRSASAFVRMANEYKSEIYITKDAIKANAKSIMGVMILGASKGDVILIEADGPDEGQAIEGLSALFDNNFNLYQ